MSVKELWFTIEMCEDYLNAKIKTNVQYYTRLRARTLKDLLEVQLKEFDRS